MKLLFFMVLKLVTGWSVARRPQAVATEFRNPY